MQPYAIAYLIEKHGIIGDRHTAALVAATVTLSCCRER